MDLCTPISFKPTRYTQSEFRHGITKLEDLIKNEDDNSDLVADENQLKYPLKHTFLDNQYVRELQSPAGQLIVTKLHKTQHPFFLLQGEISIITEKGEEHISAPYYGITNIGTKRIIYTHTACTLVTVHPTNKKDLDEIENDIIAKDYNELEEL
jgi:hypothetical protein